MPETVRCSKSGDAYHTHPACSAGRAISNATLLNLIEDEALRLRYTKCKSCSDLEREDRGE